MPEGVVADPLTGLAAVGLRNPDELALVQGRSGRVVRRVALPESPRHLALARAGGPVLVPAERADEVVEVPLRRGPPLKTVRVGHFPHDVAAAAGRVIVTNERDDTVEIAGGTTPTFKLGAPLQPGGVAAIPPDRAAVVSVRARVLTLYRLRQPRELAHANAGVGPTHVVGVLGHLYVADTQGDALLQFRLAPRLELQGRTSAPGSPYGLAVDELRRRLWVTSTATNRLNEYALGGRAPRLLATYPTVRQPNTVAVDTRSGRVFVAGRAEGVLQILTPQH